MLYGVTKDLNIAKQEMMKFIDGDTVLLGHSLDNDLQALKLIHKKIIDTSVLFASKTGKKPSLKELAFSYAKLSIQSVNHHLKREDMTVLKMQKLLWQCTNS